MSTGGFIRRSAIAAAAFAIMLAAPMTGAAQSGRITESFSITTVGMTPAGRSLTADIFRWSTDAERDQLVAAFANGGEKTWPAALQAAPAIGYVWPAYGTVGYTIRYAQRVADGDGSSRVILVTDRRLGSFERLGWKAEGQSAIDYPFSVVELRVGRNGVGEGKMSLAAKVAVDPATKSIGLDNYAAAPVLLKVGRSATGRRAPAGAAPAARRPAAARPPAPAAPATPPAK